MKTQNKSALEFTKHAISELNQDQISKINGGTLSITPNGGSISCSFCINSSNGAGTVIIRDLLQA
ncbi:hypothetical protein N7U66_12715 [Lacinutrix neustonica]|uniref:Uncharacterized protein n=1 Tax=Lacinutrix neustonica TaxID=2980107 RepID=A0A9E8SCU4_9FLAO|nr:hypothetical protein [Lacinutrix neustonica]WAC01037.1 hypothetical protein N7U66_12715 [Lacinutrix neustonica]